MINKEAKKKCIFGTSCINMIENMRKRRTKIPKEKNNIVYKLKE